MGIQLSEREMSILKFINEFGFCEVSHIMQRFNLGRSTCYEQMKVLRRFEMLNHAEVLPNYPGVYYLTVKAARLLDTDLPYFSQVPRNAYVHHMAVLRTYLKVKTEYPACEWITERRLIRQKYEDMPGSKEHLPDGIVILTDGSWIAIEVELTMKARQRLITILSDYAVDKSFSEVWYFCSPHIMAAITEAALSFPKIKTYLVEINS